MFCKFHSVCLSAARYVGVKDYVPPYLDPSLGIQELITGVSFASAGSGFDPLTPTISVCHSFDYISFHSFIYRLILESKAGCLTCIRELDAFKKVV